MNEIKINRNNVKIIIVIWRFSPNNNSFIDLNVVETCGSFYRIETCRETVAALQYKTQFSRKKSVSTKDMVLRIHALLYYDISLWSPKIFANYYLSIIVEFLRIMLFFTVNVRLQKCVPYKFATHVLHHRFVYSRSVPERLCTFLWWNVSSID